MTYSYDPNRNLKTQVKNQFNSTTISQYDYLFDFLGRRTNLTTTGTAPWGTVNQQPETKNYTTNNLNQYTEITRNPEPETINLMYDDDGNLTQMTEGTNGTKYVYDAENRLIAIEPQTPASGTTKVECSYDYMGRRVDKKVYNYQAGSWQLLTENFFLYDGWNMIQEQSSVVGQPSMVKSYIYGLDLSQTLQGAGGIGGLLASIQDNATYLYCYDGNGNVGQLINSSDDTIAAHYEYDPYGNVIVKSGLLADENTMRFSTRYFDNETGLGCWPHRYYSPSLGRWTNRDPLGEDGGNNLYAFVNNDALNHIDRLGLSWNNTDALKYYLSGKGGSLTLYDVGHYNTIYRDLMPHMNLWKIRTFNDAKAKGSSLVCPFNVFATISKSDLIGVNTSVFWIGGVSLATNYLCTIQVDCCKKKYSFSCQLSYSINDPFKDPWDVFNWVKKDWDPKGTPFYVVGFWSDNIKGEGDTL